MPFQRIEAEKLSASVVHQIEGLILRGILRPGARLPSERDLAERLGVSRPSLREAIAELSKSGLLVTRAGAGIFVADVLGHAFSPAMIRLFATHEQAIFDYLAFRRDIEGLAAERAATQGTATDLRLIGAIREQMEAAHQADDPAREASLDAEFHLAILEASHNVIMLHMMRAMFDLFREGVFYNRMVLYENPGNRDRLLAEHSAIDAALQGRDPIAGRREMVSHIDGVAADLRLRARLMENERVARLRYAHKIGAEQP